MKCLTGVFIYSKLYSTGTNKLNKNALLNQMSKLMSLFLYHGYIKTTKRNHKHLNNETSRDENSAQRFTDCLEKGK